LRTIAPDWENQDVSTGTTIVTMQFDWGVVLGADYRITTGSYIANRVTDKLTPIHDHIFCCRSGSGADTQAMVDVVTYQYHYCWLGSSRRTGVLSSHGSYDGKAVLCH
uniref:Uncharacterized protein n=1 Tax=Sciurus vulgaris TaxID=55149 RepID=A0A8D2AYV2_SCIVU